MNLVVNKYISTILLLIGSITLALGQKNRYVIYFTDKANSPFSIESPEEFLSDRALDRRQRMGIPVVDADLPVNQNYIDLVKQEGVEVYFSSRWFNLVLVEATPEQVDQLYNISVVDTVIYVAPGEKLDGGRKSKLLKIKATTNQQNAFTNITQMHTNGFTGAGVWIAVFDAGFSGVRDIAAFQHLYNENRLVMSKNYINTLDDVYRYSDHGTKVLSLIAGYAEGEYLAGAYGATMGLFVTEDVSSEYRIEEYNWLFAAEAADSAGFDIINTSLGYNIFDDPSMNYSYEEMNGVTSVIARASNMATARGILTITSAGNEGSNSWKHITTPADAFGNIAVGAVTYELDKASFSSIGPSADGRIKPDITTIGSGVKVINNGGNIVSGSGTSFAAPIVTAIAAGTMEQFPELTLSGIRSMLFSWGSLSDDPNNNLGYGILAYQGLVTSTEQDLSELKLFPNPASDVIELLSAEIPERISAYDLSGRETNLQFNNQKADISGLKNGIYVLKIELKDQVFTIKFVKE